jgi:hypothetical protein
VPKTSGALTAVLVLLNLRNATTENGFAAAFDALIDDFGQFTARNAHLATIGRRTKDVSIEPANSPPAGVDQPEFFDIVTLAFDGREQPQLFGYVKAAPPKINDVATCV